MNPRPVAKKRAEPRHKALIDWQKGLRYARAAQRNATEGDWDPAVANAVNAVINVTDAIVVQYLGFRSASDSHIEVLNLLQNADVEPLARRSLAQHLEWLVNVKSIAQYEGRLLDRSDADKALLHMERAFQAVQAVADRNGWPASI